MNDTDTRESILGLLAQRLEDPSPPSGVQFVPEEEPTSDLAVTEDEDVIDLTGSFNIDDFQVVRREFFAHLREPSVTFNECKFSVNSACLSKFPDTEYVQVLINPLTKILALWPCEEGAKDAFQWCSISKGKRKPRATTCKLFFAKVVEMMGWNPNHKYKMLGRLVHANEAYLLVFDLASTEVYQKTIKEGTKPKTSRTPVFPIGWQDQFGMPFSEHKQSMQINVFDGYAVYTIKENAPKGTTAANPPRQGDLPPVPQMMGGTS